jgi:hypothetical protein
MGCNYHFRIMAANFLAEVVKVSEAERGQWVLQLALDLVDDNPEKSKTSYGKKIIEETNTYRDKMAKAGRKGGLARASKAQAKLKPSQASLNDRQPNSSNSNSTKEPCAPEDAQKVYPEGFEKFWEAFGYKKGKGGAFSSWDKLKPNEALTDTIVAAASKEALAREKTIKQGNTPKMAQGWLTERRWEDDYEDQQAIGNLIDISDGTKRGIF